MKNKQVLDIDLEVVATAENDDISPLFEAFGIDPEVGQDVVDELHRRAHKEVGIELLEEDDAEENEAFAKISKTDIFSVAQDVLPAMNVNEAFFYGFMSRDILEHLGENAKKHFAEMLDKKVNKKSSKSDRKSSKISEIEKSIRDLLEDN